MKKIFQIFVFGLIILSFIGCSPTKKQAEKIIWGVRFDSINFTPQIITTEKKILENAGLDVEIKEMSSDDDIKTALATNQINIASMTATDSLALIAEGVPIKWLAQGSFAHNSLYVRKDSGITKLSDLKGKKIGGGIGGSSHLFVSSVLSANGIDPAKDVTFVKVKDSYKSIALIDKKEVDAVMSSPHEDEKLISEGAVVLVEWKGKGYLDQVTPRASIIARTDFVNQNFDLTKFFLEAYIKSFDYIKNNQEESAEIVAGYITQKTNGAMSYTKQPVLDYFEITRFHYWVNPDELVELANQAYANGFIEKKLNAGDIVFTEFQSLLNK